MTVRKDHLSLRDEIALEIMLVVIGKHPHRTYDAGRAVDKEPEDAAAYATGAFHLADAFLNAKERHNASL